MKLKIYLDSGIFIALLDRSDRWHPEASTLFASARVGWSTSLLVIAETHSWFLHRLGEDPARRFQTFLAELPGLEIYEVTRAHHQAVLRTLDRLRGTKLTYVDASSLTLMASYRISTVWGTDRHLALTGARVLPAGR